MCFPPFTRARPRLAPWLRYRGGMADTPGAAITSASGIDRRAEFDPDVIGVSARMRAVFEFVRLTHSSESNVLITGETGTGKDTIARLIHRSGPRRDRPFVAVSCASLPETLIEAELFGHERGAFT